MSLTLLAALAAFAHPGHAAAPQVTVRREGETWLATYELPSDEKAWAFNRSALTRPDKQSWRVGHWRVLTDGVSLERRDGSDMLVARRGTVPRTVSLRFVPRAGELFADYEPALAFSDGSLALFTGHFDVKPARVREGGTINHLTLEAPGDTILVHGATHDGRVALQDEGTYALIGEIDPLQTRHLTAFVDPGLPPWAREELVDFMPRALDYYADAMGDLSDRGRPTIMVSWKGSTPQMAGLSGSALEGLIAMAIEGEGVTSPDGQMGDRMRWFIAHEAAHFWLGQVIQYESEGDAWIMEGGADVAAIRATNALEPGFDVAAEEDREWRECEASLAKGTLDTARKRGDFQMPYSCGAVLMLGAEAVSGDYFGFVRALIAEHGARKYVSLDDWLTTFSNAGASRDAILLARQIASARLRNPGWTLREFASETGARFPQSQLAASR